MEKEKRVYGSTIEDIEESVARLRASLGSDIGSLKRLTSFDGVKEFMETQGFIPKF